MVIPFRKFLTIKGEASTRDGAYESITEALSYLTVIVIYNICHFTQFDSFNCIWLLVQNDIILNLEHHDMLN